MRDLSTGPVSLLRLRSAWVLRWFGGYGDAAGGVFVVPSIIDGAIMCVIASSGGDWDHVSVSREKRCPNWPEMQQVKRLFFEDVECVMQLHVPEADHYDGSSNLVAGIKGSPTCLHLWRPHKDPIPRPPRWMVGGMAVLEATAAARAAGVIS